MNIDAQVPHVFLALDQAQRARELMEVDYEGG